VFLAKEDNANASGKYYKAVEEAIKIIAVRGNLVKDWVEI
jgi:hypothetical protein